MLEEAAVGIEGEVVSKGVAGEVVVVVDLDKGIRWARDIEESIGSGGRCRRGLRAGGGLASGEASASALVVWLSGHSKRRNAPSYRFPSSGNKRKVGTESLVRTRQVRRRPRWIREPTVVSVSDVDLMIGKETKK